MQKQLIGALVGGIILFLWQFISWALVPLHSEVYGYTPNQDQILESLNQNLSEPGTYFLPNVPPGTSHEEAEAAMSSRMGKPWAHISYHRSMDNNMAMNMVRGFLVDVVAVFLFILLLLKFQSLNLRNILQAALSVGTIAYLTIPYLNSIWFEGSTLAHLLDAFAPWLLIGLWLNWWLNRKAGTES